MDNFAKVQHNFNRFAKSYNTHGVVQEEIAKRLFQRLDIINPVQHRVLELGSGTGFLTTLLRKSYAQTPIIATDFAARSLTLNPHNTKVCLNSHHLPFQPHSFTTVASNLMMQWCELDIVVRNALHVLQDDGLFIFSTFGPQTLIELKESWQGVDGYAHVNDFMDMHDLGDKLLALGVSGVVVESEIITLTYEKVMDLLIDLKYIGAQNTQAQPVSKSSLEQMINNYEKWRVDGKLPASYEVIYAHGFKQRANEVRNGLINNLV